MPAYRFTAPAANYYTPDKNPDNWCFCTLPDNPLNCKIDGIFDASPCYHDVPIMYSAPHFYKGNPILQQSIEGLNPDPELHSSYVDVEPVNNKS